ncbi:hypothetical protein HYS93_02855 [Candidatus Daviesbacteria bacterium]|nr:hypothetical protein [Candidatus Daviesbacteria bacterium]
MNERETALSKLGYIKNIFFRFPLMKFLRGSEKFSVQLIPVEATPSRCNYEYT